MCEVSLYSQWHAPRPSSRTMAPSLSRSPAFDIRTVRLNSAHLRQPRPDFGLGLSHFGRGSTKEKMLKGHLPRVIYYRVYLSIRSKVLNTTSFVLSALGIPRRGKHTWLQGIQKSEGLCFSSLLMSKRGLGESSLGFEGLESRD